ncbi:urease accessory protein UreE [Synechococcus sp. PCC 6312]|uniref:urease accessory protein UreE n=1 Tax=Synechococcus sp. (strain ATCC 27167 / PCC 6312) TaxID=195253 RepID=UPI00029F2039|nr:urease accessory protein UreE [Synechococcus sp. PCC 6312]AFY59506.1 urease accessory protein UreE [Synechococcus sp. PCC 6312]
MNLVAHTRLNPAPDQAPSLFLSLTATERTKSRHWFVTTTGERVFLQLPRGTVLRDGDLLQAEPEATVAEPPIAPILLGIQAQAEPVLTITAPTALELLQAAYHLGNRHVPLQIQPTYLRISPDPVLEKLLHQRGLTVELGSHPFQPELGAYHSGHDHHQP